MSSRTIATLAAALALSGGSCADDDETERAASTSPSEAPAGEAASPPPPPDAGTRAGHGADVSPTVEVPESDQTPPEATITLSSAGTRLGSASQPPGTERETVVRLERPSLRGTTVGRDADGGVARVRVSVKERITCSREGTSFTRLRTRYFPPSQIERIRSTPGAVLPTRGVRSLEIQVGGGRCGPGAEPVSIHGELWGEAINGHGLEAVTPHVRFTAAAR
jgi:hypothetical protein